MTRRRRLVGAGALALTVVVGGCSTTPEADEPARAPAAGQLLSEEPAPLAASYPPDTRATVLRYGSAVRAGEVVDTSGLLLVPPGTPPEGGWPVVAWGHGTTGIGDDCAPSSMPGAYYDDVLSDLLLRGYAVAATDYAGLGTPGTHPYLLADVAARATVDMVTAAQEAEPDLSDAWVAVGHSQGGQGTWAVAESDSLPGDYRGAAAVAPAPNFSPDLDQLVSADPLIQQFYLMSLVGLATQQDIDFGDYLSGRAQATLPAVETLCFDDLTRDIAAQNLTETDFAFRSEAAKEQLRQWFVPHEIGSKPVTQPLLVLQGTADEVVPAELTEQMVAATVASGEAVEYVDFPGATHGSVLTAARPVLDEWLSLRFG